MRVPISDMIPLLTAAPFRVSRGPDGDAQSTSSNSPAQQYYEESDSHSGMDDSQSSTRSANTFEAMAVAEQRHSPASRLPAEVLIGVFSKLSHPQDLLNCMRVSKRWARNCVDLLWHRPSCTTWSKHSFICRTLSLSEPYFAYRDFVKRLNLAGLAEDINDGSVLPLAVCNRVERLTLTNCEGLSDNGLMSLLGGSHNLLALDISGDNQITERSMEVLANNCHRLQGLNITGCGRISPSSMMLVADKCRSIKRLKLNDCGQLDNAAIMQFATKCTNLLEIDLHQCRNIGNEPVTALLVNGQSLRELRLANCELISDAAFLSLPSHRIYDHLRILDLTFCARLTDQAVEKIIQVAPRLRNLVFAKCRLLTDAAVNSISKLGKNLHYLHLGHCGQITDNSIINLVASCNRIRYIDLGCCTHLTDVSVTKLASLPKLRRIGLVKCNAITDASVIALAQSPRPLEEHSTQAQLTAGTLPPRVIAEAHGWTHHMTHFTNMSLMGSSSLERVHLSYCTNLTLNSIIYLLNHCQKLTHLSLTGVQAFLRRDLEQFCRAAPPEFTEHQRNVFCVFSGQGVLGLRQHLNSIVAEPHRRPTDSEEEETTMIGARPTFRGLHAGHATLTTQRYSHEDDEDDDVLEEPGVSFNAGWFSTGI